MHKEEILFLVYWRGNRIIPKKDRYEQIITIGDYFNDTAVV